MAWFGYLWLEALHDVRRLRWSTYGETRAGHAAGGRSSHCKICVSSFEAPFCRVFTRGTEGTPIWGLPILSRWSLFQMRAPAWRAAMHGSQKCGRCGGCKPRAGFSLGLYPGAILVHDFEPQPNCFSSTLALDN